MVVRAAGCADEEMLKINRNEAAQVVTLIPAPDRRAGGGQNRVNMEALWPGHLKRDCSDEGGLPTCPPKADRFPIEERELACRRGGLRNPPPKADRLTIHALRMSARTEYRLPAPDVSGPATGYWLRATPAAAEPKHLGSIR